MGAQIVDWNGGDLDRVREEVGETYPMGRVVNEEDVAAAVTFFLSAESSSSFLTGTILDVDGGRRLNFGANQPDGSPWPRPAHSPLASA
jgi:NAD(P)-dependent dehydrogenase (short-subunit alcohol dehydrogenase family)